MSNDEDTVDFEAGSFVLVDGKMDIGLLSIVRELPYTIWRFDAKENPKLKYVCNWVCREDVSGNNVIG